MAVDGVVYMDGPPLHGKTYDPALRGIECHQLSFFSILVHVVFSGPLVAWRPIHIT